MKFDLFVLPFSLGLLFLFGILTLRYTLWYRNLNTVDRKKVSGGFFSFRLFPAVWEVFRESLLHSKIFRRNSLLGFMHMSLAFGWFLLIAVGNLESRVFEPIGTNPPYVSIFFRYFNPNPGTFPLHRVFSFLMDLLLLIVLSGVVLAFAKRIYSKAYGMKRTTRLMLGDRFALTSLWMIFPFRLLAESLSSAAFGGGDFLTANTGKLLGTFLPAASLYYPAWWAYSLALGVFFVALPYSRYMHIPTEVVLIFSRHFGLTEGKSRTSYTEIEINSCSRCGICLDTCQLSFAGGVHTVQSAYQLKAIRYRNIQPKETLNCLMCGRCDQACPVGIDISSIRLITRNELNGKEPDPSFVNPPFPEVKKADVLYFAGCMTHQTPSIKRAMQNILKTAGISYWFMDEAGGLCCGRPMMLAGHKGQADLMKESNKKLIKASGASTLVTSCPICYKMFVQEYELDIRVVHHTEYLLELTSQQKIRPRHLNASAVYHDPCELSREIRIYEEPRRMLENVVFLNKAGYEKDDTLCCGSSLANITADNGVRMRVAADAYHKINDQDADFFVTSCPMCKKAFEQVSDVPVRDLAELVNSALQPVTAIPKKMQNARHESHTACVREPELQETQRV